MSRSGYTEDFDDDDPLALGRWRAAVSSAIRGKRGQSFLVDLLAALDALPQKRLVKNELSEPPVIIDGVVADEGGVCALGAVGRVRKMDLDSFDPYDIETVSDAFNIADAMAREITWINDEGGNYRETPEQRFERVRKWVVDSIATPPGTGGRS